MVFVVGFDSCEDDVRTEAIHGQWGRGSRRESRVEIRERRLADGEDRIAVGERDLRA